MKVLADAWAMAGPPAWLTPVWDLPALAAATVLAGGYAVCVQRVRRRGLAWSPGRSAAWTLGLAALLAVTTTGVAADAHLLLWVFTAQVLTLLLVCPVLLAYGRPVALVTDALGPTGSARVMRAMTSSWTRRLTSPLLGPLLLPAVLCALYFTPVLSLVLEHSWAADLLQLVLLGIGLVLAIALVGAGTELDSSLALGATVAIGLLEFLTDAVPGIVIRLQTHLLAPVTWAGRHRSWGPSPLRDQQHAGALLWFVAEAADLPFLAILIRRWIRADEREAAAADRAADVIAGARAAGLDSPDAGAVKPPAPDVGRPWWETDPSRLAGHRLARDYPLADELPDELR